LYAQEHPSGVLRIIGDGPLRKQLSQGVNAIDSGRIVWVGSLSGAVLANEYLSATALILPSLSEPWGLVVNEALAYGCPVIVSSTCGCVPELVIEGESGYTVDPRSALDIKQKMQMVLSDLSGEGVSRFCCRLASQYTPQRAASEICQGIESVSLGPCR
jgi:glycosyltransferase involved in cell wall biosynthesis